MEQRFRFPTPSLLRLSAAGIVALVALAIMAVSLLSTAAASHGGSVVCDPATGHCYEYLAGPMEWEDAKVAAEALTHNGVAGHLATVTSAAETTFIVNNLPDAVFHHPPFDGGAWIGAFQAAGSGEPGGGWQWVTGEPWAYTNWAGGEPNNSGGIENAANFWQGAGAWNDVDGSLLKGYLVEYDDVPVVYSSGAHVETWDPIIPSTQPGNWPSTICVPTPAVGPDAAWVNPHAAFAFGMSAATFQTSYAQFTAEWINAWDSIASVDTADFGGTAPYHNWTKYSTTITGTGTFDLSLLADNCSWIFLDGVLVGFQSTDLSIQTYPVSLFGTHTLEFIIFDGGGQAGGMFLLETSSTTPLDTDGDGLFDFSEVHLYGTDPNNPDTDGDGVSDGDEVQAGTDPLAPPPDTTPPTVTVDVTGTLGDNDWYIGDVDVVWTVADGESEVTSTTGCDATTVTADTAGVTLTCEATSAGGTASESVALKRDATAPVASASRSPLANANGWNNTDVTVSFSGVDLLSGIAACDADIVLGEGTGQSASGTCTDNAGNVSNTASVSDINVDKTAPAVTVTGVTEGATYTFGAEPTPACDTSDALSGIATAATATVSGGPVGSFTVECGGAFDLAGNTGAATATYTIAYDFCGFEQPLLAPVQVFKTGSTVPVKFCVQDASGNFVGGLDPEVYADGELQGEAKQTGSKYHFNLRTKGMDKGPLLIEVRLVDGSTHSIEVGLK